MVEQSVVWIILLVVFFVVILGGLGIGGLIYYNMSGKTVEPVKKDDTVKKEETKKDDKSTPTGVYYISGGDGYVNGWTFVEAVQKVLVLGSALATKEKLMMAHEKGLDLCSYGWIAEGDAGLVLQKARSNCGGIIGYNSSGLGQDRRSGIWAYGVIPKDTPANSQIAGI